MFYMKRYFAKYRCFVFLLFTVLLVQSCKTDEFKFSEITIKEDFGVKIIVPVFAGSDKQGHHLEFRDFIHDWKKPISDPSGPYTVLRFSDGTFKEIPTRLIFDFSSIIDSLQFLIQGNYKLKDLELVFTVTNSSPFPLNLQVQFIDNNIPGPPFLPPPFPEADFNQTPVKPFTQVHIVPLDSLQTESFANSKRINLSSWYDPSASNVQKDTLSAHYPIDLSIVMIGTVQIKNE